MLNPQEIVAEKEEIGRILSNTEVSNASLNVSKITVRLGSKSMQTQSVPLLRLDGLETSSTVFETLVRCSR